MYVKQIKHDYYIEKKVKYVRTVWRSSHYNKLIVNQKWVKNELQYWKYDIEEQYSDGEGGLIVDWKDSYIPDCDIVRE